MKTKILRNILTAVNLLAALGILVCAAAPDSPAQQKPKHRTYRLIDLGTLGGPTSYSYAIIAQSMNARAAVIGQADTLMPDPNFPNCNFFIFTNCPDPFLEHAFISSHGVLTDLGAIPGGSSGAFWINDAGVVAGASTTGSIDPLTGLPAAEAVIWKNGTMIRLGDLGGHQAFANAVNDREQVGGFGANTIPDPFSLFGFFCDPTGSNCVEMRAFVSERGVMRDIGTLGGPDAYLYVINNRGAVGISYTNSTPNPTTGIPTADPFLWVNGRMTDLGTLGGTIGDAEWINNAGQVVGTSDLAGDLVTHPYLWDHGVMTDLGTLGGDNGFALNINDAGTIIGFADLPDGTHHGFIWKRGVMSDVGTIGSDPCSNVAHLNGKEQVIGFTTDCQGTKHRAFLWENGEIADLNSLVNPPSNETIVEATDINERGEITADAILPNGDEHVVLLIPNGDCDSSCESRIAASQSNAPLAPISKHPRLNPAERVRMMMRQRPASKL